ncbi:conserved Plasmodium protein, unknown function [Plasmodium malariae]|uniref:MORN repeat protein n=1 Tax=Plasmodium malariae TaxID=5858 RepID=A0A1D3RI98_PLAMA|nr:conserved Plasmodium protein, unknown function [Plasmodium malariae]SCN44900.1 conserved Plasmodium protein, unknown function [Plasmodium malariae]
MEDVLPTKRVDPKSYELFYWRNFFSKEIDKEHNSLVEITSCNTVKLRNVKINSTILNGFIKIDHYMCPYFYKNFVISNDKKKYEGSFRNRHIEGVGKIITDHFIYEGYIYRGKKWKRGKCSFIHFDKGGKQNIIYEGFWVNNKRNGWGTLKLVNKDQVKLIMYKGFWKNNERDFYGIQYYNDNSVYFGYWKRNKKFGFGKMVWYFDSKGGSKGKFVENLQESIKMRKHDLMGDVDNEGWTNVIERPNIIERTTLMGRKTAASRLYNTYLGEWKNDKFHGYGTYIWFFKKKKNEIIYQNEKYDQYSGYWRKGKKNGYGIFYYNCGKKYIGMWKDNKKDGVGYFIKLNGIVSKCLYKSGKLISDIDLNVPYRINNTYTNSLCRVINLFFFKKYFNITNKKIEFVYKVIYANFPLLVDIYNRYKKKNGKQRYKQKQTNRKTHNQARSQNYQGTFHLHNLWNMFYHANIINYHFTLCSLNKLVTDHTSMCEHLEMFNLLVNEKESTRMDEILINEKDLVKSFFKSKHLLNIPVLSSSLRMRMKQNGTFSHKDDEKNVFNSTEDCQNAILPYSTYGNSEAGTRAYEEVSTSECIVRDDKVSSKKTNFSLQHYNKVKSKSNKNLLFVHMNYIIFNKNLISLKKNCTNLYKHYWKECCMHKRESHTILQKMFIILLRNKKNNNNCYLYYVLVSLFQYNSPLLYFLFRPHNKKWSKWKKYSHKRTADRNNTFSSDHQMSKDDYKNGGMKRTNVEENINNEVCNPVKEMASGYFKNERVAVQLKDKKMVTHLNNIISFLNVNRCYIHDEKRKISFNCFIFTLVHISIRMSNFGDMTQVFLNLINSLKRLSFKRDGKKLLDNDNNNMFRKRITEVEKKKKKNLYNMDIIKYVTTKCTRNGMMKRNIVGKNNNICNNFLKISHTLENTTGKKKEELNMRRKHENITNEKNGKKKNFMTCAVCCYHDKQISKFCKRKTNCAPYLQRKERTYRFSNEEKSSKELVNILNIFAYYYIFYFLIFESGEKSFSIFSTKLNVSMRLRDILIFLFQLKLIKKNKVKNNVTCVNLDTYSLLHKKGGKKKLNVKIWNFLTGACGNEKNEKNEENEENEENVSGKVCTVQAGKNREHIDDNMEEKQEKLNSGCTSKSGKQTKNIEIRSEKKGSKKDSRSVHSVISRANGEATTNLESEKCTKNGDGRNDRNDGDNCGNHDCRLYYNNNSEHNAQTDKKNNLQFVNLSRKKNIYMNSSGKNKASNKKALNKFSSIFYLSFFEILAIFCDIFNCKNLHLINTTCYNLYATKLKKKKRRKKISKCRLKNNVVHYIMILEQERKKFLVKFSQCAGGKTLNGKKLCSGKMISGKSLKNERIRNGMKKRACRVHTKLYKEKALNRLNEKLDELCKLDHLDQIYKIDRIDRIDRIGRIDRIDKIDKIDRIDRIDRIDKIDKITWEQGLTGEHIQSKPPGSPEKAKKRNDIGGKSTKCLKKKKAYCSEEDNKCIELRKSEHVLHTNVIIKRKSEIKILTHSLKRKFINSHKNYMNVLDYYNIYITPYEFLLFFLKFVERVKRKKNINSSYNDVLFFFIFHILLYRTFQLAKKKK